eukprot:2565585-Amphidinium_carterae.1
MEPGSAELWQLLDGMGLAHPMLVADYDDDELQAFQGTLNGAGHVIPLTSLSRLRESAKSICHRAAGNTLAGLRQTRFVEQRSESDVHKEAHQAMCLAAPNSKTIAESRCS